MLCESGFICEASFVNRREPESADAECLPPASKQAQGAPSASNLVLLQHNLIGTIPAGHLYGKSIALLRSLCAA
jgi:hypothetical protein